MRLSVKQRACNKAWLQKRVVLVRDVRIKSGTVYKAGSLWLVTHTRAGTFSLVGILGDGGRELNERGWIARVIRNAAPDCFEHVPT